MSEPLAYLNGNWIPASQAVIPVTDAGFMQGVTVSEQLRTFNGRLFELPRHLARLERSLAIVGVELPLSVAELGEKAQELATKNHALLQPGDDLGLSMFVTPGIYPTYLAAASNPGPCYCLHTYPLPFSSWAHKYEQGETLVVTDVRQVPTDCWPAELKCRSRMHYFLADRAARQKKSGARAVMLDQRGFVTEASTANLLTYRARDGMISPPRASILPGVSVAVLMELAAELSIPWSERDLTVDDVAAADEVLLCSTSPCVWPVTEFDGQTISDGAAGPIARQLLAAFSERAGVDIAAQAKRFSFRSPLLGTPGRGLG
jgi:branched-subunit amino acid aminotransferase/4-amino-4-deoxychorismate lyase